jgi:hypothetical protein
MIFNGETDSRKLPEIQDGGNVSDIPVCSTVQSRHSFSWQRASKKFCCSVCMKTFFTARCLRHHVTFQHLSRKMLPVAVAKEFIRSIPRRPFDQLRYCVRCIYCRELFASRKYLQMHQTCCVKSSASLGYQQRKVFSSFLNVPLILCITNVVQQLRRLSLTRFLLQVCCKFVNDYCVILRR